jgi:hypothetical protein
METKIELRRSHLAFGFHVCMLETLIGVLSLGHLVRLPEIYS